MKAFTYLIYCGYKVREGSEYLGTCYGPNAWMLSTDTSDAVVDTITHRVYEVAVHLADKCYKWVDPDFLPKYIEECESKGYDPWIAYDDVKYEQETNGSKILSIIP